MARLLDRERLQLFLDALGRACRGPGVLYLIGGATALLEGWRDSSLDVDLKLDPEPEGVFAAIARIKEELEVNVEFTSPTDFLPELRDSRSQSRFVGRFGPIEVRHSDFRAQALSKLARGFERDLDDVQAMLERGLVTRDGLRAALAEMSPRLERFPRVDAAEILLGLDSPRGLERAVMTISRSASVSEIGVLDGLPGADLVLRNLADLAEGEPTAEAALVEVARTRIERLGLALAGSTIGANDAGFALYARLQARESDRNAYGLYDAWLDQLVSFLAALRNRRNWEARKLSASSGG